METGTNIKRTEDWKSFLQKFEALRCTANLWNVFFPNLKCITCPTAIQLLILHFRTVHQSINSAVLLEPSCFNREASPSILFTWRTVSVLQQVNENYGDVCLLRGEALAKSSIAVLTCNTCKNCSHIVAKFLQCSILTTYIKENMTVWHKQIGLRFLVKAA